MMLLSVASQLSGNTASIAHPRKYVNGWHFISLWFDNNFIHNHEDYDSFHDYACPSTTEAKQRLLEKKTYGSIKNSIIGISNPLDKPRIYWRM